MPPAESRFEELRRYVRFDADDERALEAARPFVLPAFDGLADVFYERIREHPEAHAVFQSDAQIERQKGALKRWLSRVMHGPYDEAYFAETTKIGHVHVAVGLPQRYMLTGMNIIREHLHAALGAAPPADQGRLRGALDRALDLELAGMLDSYFWALLKRAQEAERVQATRRSERLAAIGTLAAGLAHEIRNPLNGAQLHLTLVERGLVDKRVPSAELVDAVQTTKREVLRLSKLVTEFLEFARPMPLRPSRIDLRELSVGALLTMQADATSKQISLEAVGPTIHVHADHDKLLQVVLNLVRNAIEACGPGGRVVARTMREEDHGVLQIEDDGQGIADTSAPLFDPFFTTKPTGTGLGLPIAHRIVTDHDGTLGFTSEPGRTVFSIRLYASGDA